MDRRRFLTLTSALAGLGATATAAATTTATVGQPGVEAPDPMTTARKRARSMGKPLLAAWIPADANLAQARGALWGAFFRQASDRQIGVLALCEVVFVRPPEDQAQEASKFIGTLERSADGKTTPIPLGPSASAPTHFPLWAALAEGLEQALAPDMEAVKALCQQLPGHTQYGLTQFLAFDLEGGSPSNLRIPANHLEPSAAAAWRHMLERPKSEEYLAKELSRCVLTRLFDQDPPGASWGINLPEPCPPCGMARIPPSARLLLSYYTKD